jgi:cytochrome c-type biogenesis protein CcmH/NrfG
MERAMKKCTGMDEKLADMLLAPETVPAKVSTHVANCEACNRELEELRATMGLLDTWQAPEPNPYFLTQLNARLDEERRAEPAGLLERLRARFTYGSPMHARPLVAMALTVVLLLGGGTYLAITNWDQPAAPQQAAVIHDLQVLDNNAQLLDQLESLSSSDNSEN